MTKDQHIFRIGAIGAGVSTLTLILMAFLSFPRGLEYPGVSVLTGELILSKAELAAFLSSLRILYILDGIFLLGWFISWAAIAEVVRSRYRIFGILTLIFGLAGALFDFGENSIIWGVVQNLEAGRALNNDWVITWKAVQHLSYWLPFIAAVFAASGLWSKKTTDRILSLIGTLLVLPAVIGIYIPSLSLLPNLWFLFWFAGSGLLLWRYSAEDKSSQSLNHQKEG